MQRQDFADLTLSFYKYTLYNIVATIVIHIGDIVCVFTITISRSCFPAILYLTTIMSARFISADSSLNHPLSRVMTHPFRR